MEQKPIKRSKHIMAFSKDHHAGLLFCWKIKEGLKCNIEMGRIKRYVNFFWDSHLKEHFSEEEGLLLNEVDDPLCRQAKTEHLMLTDRLNKLNDEKEAYAVFAELLIKHIRFEERTLFPHLEIVLPLSTLNAVGDFLNRYHSEPFIDNYPDEFWISEKRKAD